jgi:hypothetical protein
MKINNFMGKSNRVETPDNIYLMEYSPEDVYRLHKIYRKYKTDWIITEKGLFMLTREIEKPFKYDYEKILAYYRSDEAVQEQQLLLEIARK